MAKTASINARIEPIVKERAESIFAAIGISASDAIGMFYRQVAFKKGLPFDVCVPDATTVAALEDWSAVAVRIVDGPTTESLTGRTSYTKHRSA